MFEVTVETTFAAAHALRLGDTREPLHGHNWHVTVTLAGPTLDPDGLLVDFHAVEHLLRDITAPFHNANLNDTPPFTDLNPSAENVALHIARALVAGLRGGRASIRSVRVTEAPGCAATYYPPTPTPAPDA